VGLAHAEEQQWWEEQERQPTRLGEGADPADLARFLAGEAFVLDVTQPPYDALPNPHGVHMALIAPMRAGGTLGGVLVLDYSGAAHTFSPEEQRLAEAVAKLGALAIERERLLHEREVARSRSLALQETTQRMDHFLGIVSHELKTPLTVLHVNAQILARR